MKIQIDASTLGGLINESINDRLESAANNAGIIDASTLINDMGMGVTRASDCSNESLKRIEEGQYVSLRELYPSRERSVLGSDDKNATAKAPTNRSMVKDSRDASALYAKAWPESMVNNYQCSAFIEELLDRYTLNSVIQYEHRVRQRLPVGRWYGTAEANALAQAILVLNIEQNVSSSSNRSATSASFTTTRAPNNKFQGRAKGGKKHLPCRDKFPPDDLLDSTRPQRIHNFDSDSAEDSDNPFFSTSGINNRRTFERSAASKKRPVIKNRNRRSVPGEAGLGNNSGSNSTSTPKSALKSISRTRSNSLTISIPKSVSWADPIATFSKTPSPSSSLTSTEPLASPFVDNSNVGDGEMVATSSVSTPSTDDNVCLWVQARIEAEEAMGAFIDPSPTPLYNSVPHNNNTSSPLSPSLVFVACQSPSPTLDNF
eukprot:g1295.t1